MSETAFLEYLQELHHNYPRISWEQLVEECHGPGGIALLVVDLVRGFCDQGPLASPRIQALVEPVARFLEDAHDAGVTKIFMGCDAHPPDSPEFSVFPRHCVEGTSEADLAPGLAQLPFAQAFQHIPKRTLSSWLGTDLESRLRSDPDLRTLVIVGDCTDLCVHQAALQAKLLANLHYLPWDIVVVSSLVDTYDLPMSQARKMGVTPHPGDLLHRIFLYHLHLNGVRVVREIAP